MLNRIQEFTGTGVLWIVSSCRFRPCMAGGCSSLTFWIAWVTLDSSPHSQALTDPPLACSRGLTQPACSHLLLQFSLWLPRQLSLLQPSSSSGGNPRLPSACAVTNHGVRAAGPFTFLRLFRCHERDSKPAGARRVGALPIASGSLRMVVRRALSLKGLLSVKLAIDYL